MPYIPSNERRELDVFIEHLGDRILTPGQLNYTISRLLSLSLTGLTQGSIGYHELSRWRAAVADASLEFYRRIMAPYEDSKLELNGEVYQELLRKLP